MAAAQDRKRSSKATKKKAKKVEAPAEESEPEDQPETEEKVEAGEEPEADESKVSKKRKMKTKANRLEEMAAKADEEPKEPRGVIYVGHIPDGFFEPQMRKFFSQFGAVTRLRISRSKRTGRQKGYAFIEFEEESVAKIVAETMKGYLLFEKTLVCHLLPKEKQHPALFKGCKRPFRNFSGLRRKRHAKAYNDRPTVEVDGQKVPRHTLRQVDRRKRSDAKLNGLLSSLGVDYDLAGVDGASVKSPKSGAAKSPKLAASSSPKVAAASSPKTAPAGAPAATSAAPKKKKRKVPA